VAEMRWPYGNIISCISCFARAWVNVHMDIGRESLVECMNIVRDTHNIIHLSQIFSVRRNIHDCNAKIIVQGTVEVDFFLSVSSDVYRTSICRNKQGNLGRK